MFLRESRARSPKVAGSAAQISTILSTGKYVAGCAEWSEEIGCLWRSDVFEIAASSVLLKCDRYDRDILRSYDGEIVRPCLMALA
jgi:hypothetical protein